MKSTVLNYWGSRYGLSLEDFTRPQTIISPTPQLEDKGIFYLYAYENVHVLRPDPKLIPQLEALIAELPDGTKIGTAELTQRFGDRLVHDGDHPHLYLEKDQFKPVTMPEDLVFRRLMPEEYGRLDPFLARQSEEDIEFADITPEDHDPVIVCGFDGETIAAYASYRPLSNYGGDDKYGAQIGDVGVLVDPPYRSRGYARAIVSYLSQWCVDNQIIPQYQVLETHTHSYHIPLALGYTQLITATEYHLK